jgi:hypothetical protein
MNIASQIAAHIIGLLLDVLVLDALRRGPYRRYPFLFLYVIGDFLTTVLEIEPSLAFNAGTAGAQHQWSVIYWRDAWIMQGLLFLLVISLLYHAGAQMRARRTILLGVIGATLMCATVSLMVHHQPGLKTGQWMTPWTRDLNLGSAILDLGLWGMLIQSREKDYRLLMVSGALGIQFAAGAMGQALREISRATVPATGLMIMFANLTCTYIWWQAFRPAKKNPKNALTKNRAA